MYKINQIKCYLLPGQRRYQVDLRCRLILRTVYHELDSSPRVDRQVEKPTTPAHHVVGNR